MCQKSETSGRKDPNSERLKVWLCKTNHRDREGLARAFTFKFELWYFKLVIQLSCYRKLVTWCSFLASSFMIVHWHLILGIPFAPALASPSRSRWLVLHSPTVLNLCLSSHWSFEQVRRISLFWHMDSKDSSISWAAPRLSLWLLDGLLKDVWLW